MSDINDYMEQVKRQQREDQDAQLSQTLGSVGLDATGSPIANWQPQKAAAAPASTASMNPFVRSVEDLHLGTREGFAFVSRTGSNAFSLMDKAADKVSEWTGFSKGGALGVVSSYLRDLAEQTQPTEKDFAGRDNFADYLYRGIGAAPAAIGAYALGGWAVGSGIAGMALIDALRESDKGAWESIKAGVQGALMGTALKVIEPFSRPARAALGAAGFGGAAALEGGNAQQIASQAVLGGGLAALHGNAKEKTATETDAASPVEEAAASVSKREVIRQPDLTAKSEPIEMPDLTKPAQTKLSPADAAIQAEMESARIEADAFIRQKGIGGILENVKRTTTDPTVRRAADEMQTRAEELKQNGSVVDQLKDPELRDALGLPPEKPTEAEIKTVPAEPPSKSSWFDFFRKPQDTALPEKAGVMVSPRTSLPSPEEMVAFKVQEAAREAQVSEQKILNVAKGINGAAKENGDIAAALKSLKERAAATFTAESGFSTTDINLAIVRTMAGAIYGYGQGDTIEDRIKNALLYGGLASLASPKSIKAMIQVARRIDPNGIKAVEMRDGGMTPTVSRSFDPKQIDTKSMAEFLRMTNNGIDVEGRVQGVNYDHINTPMDVKYVIGKMAKLYQGEIDKARKVEGVSHEDTVAAAEALKGTKTEEKVQTWPDGKPMTDPELLLTRMVRNDLGAGLKETSGRLMENPSRENVVSFIDTFNRYRMVQQVYAGQASGRGRGLEALKIDVGSSGELEFHRMLGNVVESVDPTGWTPARLAAAISQVPDLEALSRATEIAARPGMADMMLEAFYGIDMLSNPKTPVVNAVGSPLAMGWQVAKRSIAAGFTAAQGKIGDPNYVQPSEPAMMLQAIKDGYQDAFSVAKKAFDSGERQYPYGTGGKQSIARPNAITYDNLKTLYPRAFDMTESALSNMGVDAQRLKFGIDLLGGAARLFPRMMLAADEFNELIGARMELYARSARSSAAEGLTLKEQAQLARDKIYNMDGFSSADKEAAKQFALYNTFNQEPGTISSRIVGAIESINKAPDIDPVWYLATRAVVPFVTIPANIARWAARESGPTAFLSRDLKEKMARGGADAQVAWAGVALGSMVMTLAANMAMNGHLNGAAPVQKSDRQVWEADGNIEYSLKTPVGSFGINRLDPISIPFAWAADFVNLAGHVDAYDGLTLAAMSILTMTHDLASKNYVQGVTNFLHAITSMDSKEIQQFVKGEVGSLLVPGIVRGVRQETDPYRRETNTAFDAARAMTPWGSTDYPPVLDRFARPIYSGYGASQGWASIFGIINPIQYRAPNESKVINEITSNKIPVPGLSDTIFGARDNPYDNKPADSRTGVKLEGWEFYLYNKYSGEKLFELLSREVEKPQWKTATGGPDGGKAAMFGVLVSAADEYARRRLLGESSDLSAAVKEKQTRRRDALRPAGELLVPRE
jgi:hypothetical protein